MTIKQKIIGKSLLTCVLVAVMGVLSTISAIYEGRALTALEQKELSEVRYADEVESAAGRILLELDDHYVAASEQREADATQFKQKIDVASAQIDQALSHMRNALQTRLSVPPQSAERSETQKDQERLEALERHVEAWRTEWKQLSLAAGKANGDSKASVYFAKSMGTIADVMQTALEFERGSKNALSTGLRAAQWRTRIWCLVMAGASAGAVILTLALGWIVAMPLAMRLLRLRDGAVQIGGGQLDTRIAIDSRDEIGQLAAAFNDMAQRLERSRDAAEENRSKFEELAETIREVFWVTSADGAKMQYISPAYEEVWGRSRQSLYREPRSFVEAILPEDRPRVLAALANQVNVGLDQEYRIQRPDGQIRWIHDRGFVVRDETGQIKRLVGIAEDITERKQAEAALRQSEAMLARAQRVANIGSWDWDIRESRLIWSEQYYRIFDVDPAVFTPTYETVINAIHPDDRAKVEQAVKRALAGEERYCIEYRITARDGSIRVVLAQGDVDRDEAGVPIRMVGTALDVTERNKAAAAIKQAHDELEQRVELRTAELNRAIEALRQKSEELKKAKEAAEAANRSKSDFLAT